MSEPTVYVLLAELAHISLHTGWPGGSLLEVMQFKISCHSKHTRTSGALLDLQHCVVNVVCV